MGVEKKNISPGDGTTRPKKGDTVTMEYTGWLFDPSKPDTKGTQYVEILGRSLTSMSDIAVDRFDSSVGRGAFDTKIGTGQVIKGMH
jgi:FK506-binding protein 1